MDNLNLNINESIENIRKSKNLINKITKELNKTIQKNNKIKIEFKPTIKIEVYADEKLTATKKATGTKKATATKKATKRTRKKKEKSIKNKLYNFFYPK